MRDDWREAHRDTWMHATQDVLAKFVLRGIGAAAGTVREWRQGDIVFLPALASLDRPSGPLFSLILWLRCALSAWPAAGFIGKADDDVWVHLPATAIALDQALADH